MNPLDAMNEGKRARQIRTNNEKTLLPIIVGEDVHRYEIPNAVRWIDVSDVRKDGYDDVKILIRQLGNHINATIDINRCVNIQSVYNIVLRDSNDINKLSILLGILNSRFSDFIYKIITSYKFEFQRIILDNIREIPVAPNWENASLIAKIVRTIMDGGADTIIMERNIDVLVYLLYGLTYDEVVVENALEGEKLNLDKISYNKWLTCYTKDGSLPNEEELKQVVEI